MSETPRPSRFDIERYHTGEADPETARRVEADPEAMARVAALEQARKAFARERPDAADFARALRARTAPAAEPRRRWLRWLMPLAGAAAVAALVLFAALPGLDAERSEVLRPKGDAVDTSVIVLRDGVQTRESGTVGVRPGDRVRISLDVQVAGPLTVGIVDRDGSWVVLADSQAFTAGRHDLERTFRVDAGPTRAAVVAGPPNDVARARRSGSWAEVTRLTLLSDEGAP